MKFILNKDKLEIKDKEDINSGSIKYYEADIEHDESWDNLTIEAIFTKGPEKKGTSIAVIDNKMYLDKEIKGRYFIGFVGYTIKDGVKEYQISSDLCSLYFCQGAGEIETVNSQSVPTPTEWEIYVAQIKSIVGEIEGLSEGLESRVSEVETKLENGDFNGADGQDGKDGKDGHDGADGKNGADGISPTLKETATQDGYDLTITDINGTRTIHLTNGQDGKDGQPGKNGTDGVNGKDGKDGENGKDGINGKDGTNGQDGQNGKDGKDGNDGYTPVRGTDYWTSSDISVIEQHCDTYIDGKIGSLNSVVSSIEEVVG